MRIESLAIRRLPGIQDGFEINDLSPGLNLIIGPNGSGKTSLCRAFRSLIWPQRDASADVSILAHLVGPTGVMRVEQNGAELSWSQHGEEIAPPSLPEAHLAKCFTIEVGDLVAAETADEDLAREVLRQMAGGYDLRNLLEASAYRVKNRHGVVARDALQKARSTLAAVRAQHLGLREREAGLEDLERSKRAARLARDDQRSKEMALEYVRAKHSRHAADARLEQFHAAMSKLQGDEAERLAELRRDLADKITESDARQEAIDVAHEGIEAAALAEGALELIDLEKQMASIDELRSLEAERGTQSERLSAAQARADRALQQIGGRDMSITCIDDAVLRRAEAFLKRVESQARQRSEIDSRLSLLKPIETVEPMAELREGLAALTAWQAVPRPSSTYSERMRLFAGGLILVGLVTSSILALQTHPAFWSLAALSTLLGALALCQRDQASSAITTGHRERFKLTGLATPSTWTRDDVERRIRSLSAALAIAGFEAEKDLERRRIHAHDAEVQAAEKELAIERQRLLRDTGLDLSIANLSLVLLTRNLADHQAAALHRDQIQRRCDELERRAAAQAADLVTFLAVWGEVSESTVVSISLHTERLRQRLLDGAAYSLRLRDAISEKTRLQRDLDRLAQKESWLFSSLDLAPGDDHTLSSRLAGLADYREARAAALEAGLAEKISRDKLSDHQHLPTEDELQAELGALNELAGSYEELVNEIAAIRQQIRSAREGRDLADALLGEARSLDDLQDRLDEAALATAGRFLLSAVEEQHAKEARPEILDRAIDWFSEFTQHQFELQLSGGWGEEPARFRALDTCCNKIRNLAELSTGTRSQLLIAVRMAAAVHAERGEPLPFFLDDALSTSDPERFRSVVRSLSRLAQHSHRQVFYLTSRPEDASVWQAHAEIHIVDLGELRALGRSITDPEELVVPSLPEVLLPRDLSAEQYAFALKVPRFEPLRETSEVHLFYLLRHDLDLLYRCLRERIQFLGPLRSLLAGGRQTADLTAADRDQLGVLIELTRCFAQSWRVGRGRPLDRKALRDAGVTDRFLDGFVEIAAESQGSAETLMHSIEERQDERVKGFRTDKLESVREHLLSEGYLDLRETMSEDEIRAELFRALEPAIDRGLLSDSSIVARVHELAHYARARR